MAQAILKITGKHIRSLAFGKQYLSWAWCPNPKFAHIMRQMRSRTSGSKGALEL